MEGLEAAKGGAVFDSSLDRKSDSSSLALSRQGTAHSEVCPLPDKSKFEHSFHLHVNDVN